MASIINATTSTGLVSSADNSGSLQLATNNGTTAITIDTSQNVGIGTASPSVKCHVSSSAGVALRIDNPSSTSTGLQSYLSGNLTSAVDFSTSGTIFYQNAGSGACPERMRIDSSGNLLFNSGYGSVATAYGCRAWVNFNGTGTVAIRASGNVTSITDNGTGDYTVNFTNAMPDTNYMATQSCGNNNWGVTAIPAATNSTSSLLLQSTTQYRVYSSAASGGTSNTDVAVMFVAIFR